MTEGCGDAERQPLVTAVREQDPTWAQGQISGISKWGLGFSRRPKHVGAMARRGRWEQIRSPGVAVERLLH